MSYLYDNLSIIKKWLKNNVIFLFLDFDGTLAEIAPTPAKASLPVKTKKILKNLSDNPKCKLIFISGRSLKDIKKKIGIPGAVYSGNHGLEIEGPGIKFRFLVDKSFSSALRGLKKKLRKNLKVYPGAFIEDKGLSISLHYRLLDKKMLPRLKAMFRQTVGPFLSRRQIKINRGKKVLEIRPPIAWDKGKAALWLLARQSLIGKKKILPVYVGDDISDEDAFRALNKNGLTFFVGENKVTYAKYRLKGPPEVTRFLGLISEI